MMSGVRAFSASPGAARFSAEVAIKVRGHSVFDATRCARNSSAMPSATRLMAYFDVV